MDKNQDLDLENSKIDYDHCLGHKFQSLPFNQRELVCRKLADLPNRSGLQTDSSHASFMKQLQNSSDQMDSQLEDCRGCNRKGFVKRLFDDASNLYSFMKDKNGGK